MNLKYKIWDIPYKTWVEAPYCINQYGDLQIKDVIFSDNDNFKVFLYTGKNDSTRTVEFPKGKPIYVGDILQDDSNIYVVRFGEYQANNNQSYNDELAYGFYIEYIEPARFEKIIDHATRIQYGIIIGCELED